MQLSKSISTQLGTVAVLLFSMGAFAAFENLDRAGDSRFQLAWAAIYVLFAFAFVPWRKAIFRAAQAQKWLLVLVAWTLLSTLWSADPSLTFRRAFALACTTVLGLYLGVRFTQRELLHLLALSLAIAVSASAIVAVCLPNMGVMQDLYGGAWRGIFNHKNTLAMVTVLSLIIFGSIYHSDHNRRVPCAFAIALAVLELLLSKSVGPLFELSIVTVIVLLFWMRRSLSRPLLIPSLYWVGGLAAALGGWLVVNSTSALALVGRDPTLTGRTTLWAFAVDAMRQRLWLGYGYDAFWLGPGGDAIRAAVGWDAPQAHNGFLDLSLDIGLIGTALFLLSLIPSFRRAVQHALRTPERCQLWPLLYLTLIVINSFTETTTVTGNSIYWLIYVALSVQLWENDDISPYSPMRHFSPALRPGA